MPAIDPRNAREALAYFSSWLGFRRDYLRVPGIQAAALLGDEIVLDVAYGIADIDTGEPLRTDHLFRVASHSKTFTATAIFQLLERGRLRLDDEVGAYVPSLGEAGSALATVTIRELLAHAGGVVRDGADGDHWQLRGPFPDGERLQAITLEQGASVTPANASFKYSNIGYSLLGQVIERASGQTYAAYVQEHILDVLGLAHTGPELPTDRSGDLTAGHSALAYAPERVTIEHIDTRAMASATGFFSTARDLVAYFAAHFLGDERVLSDRSKRAMQQRQWQTGTDPQGGAYALGLSLTPIGERTLIGHGGGYPGHITSSVADVHDRLAISVLTNAIDGPAQESVLAAVHLLDLAAKLPRPADGPDLARFAGRFADLWGVLDIAVLGGRLWMLTPTDANPAAEAVELTVVDDHTLRIVGGSGYGSAGEPVGYTFLDDGTVASLRAGSGVTRWPLDAFRLPGKVTTASTSR
jgi:D-alanyl-D-alanine carboxypeptidase